MTPPDLIRPRVDAVEGAVFPLILCACGAVVQACTVPDCSSVHTLHVVAACGVCTATGGTPVMDDEPTP